MRTKVSGKVEYRIPIKGKSEQIPTTFTITVSGEKLTLPTEWSLSERQIKALEHATQIETNNAHGQLDLKIRTFEVWDDTLRFQGQGTWTGNENVIYSSVGKMHFPLDQWTTVVQGLYLMPGEQITLDNYKIRKKCFRRLFNIEIEDALTYAGQETTEQLLKLAAEKAKEYGPMSFKEEQLKKNIEKWIKQNTKPLNDIASRIQEQSLMAKMNIKEWPPELDEAARKINQWMIEAKGISLQEYLSLL